jgi:flagella basal body P-ring formation protein FlgA
MYAFEAVCLAFTAAWASDDFDITLSGFITPLVPAEMATVSTVSQLEYDSNTGRFTASLTVTGDGIDPIDTRISGRVDEMVEAPVALTRLRPETVLHPDDLRMARIRTPAAPNEIVRSIDQLVDATRRPVAAGQPLRSSI